MKWPVLTGTSCSLLRGEKWGTPTQQPPDAHVRGGGHHHGIDPSHSLVTQTAELGFSKLCMSFSHLEVFFLSAPVRQKRLVKLELDCPKCPCTSELSHASQSGSGHGSGCEGPCLSALKVCDGNKMERSGLLHHHCQSCSPGQRWQSQSRCLFPSMHFSCCACASSKGVCTLSCRCLHVNALRGTFSLLHALTSSALT